MDPVHLQERDPVDDMLKDVAEQFYFDNYNCAESVFLAANSYYSLGIDPSSSKLVGGFGGGIQTGSSCGAFLAAVSILSVLCIDKKAHESGTLKNAVSLFVSEFGEKMQSTLCSDIRPRVFEPSRRCAVTVDAVCDTLEDVIRRGGLIKDEA